jgi:hypothetical protein
MLVEICQGWPNFSKNSCWPQSNILYIQLRYNTIFEASQLIETCRHNLMATQVVLELVAVD